MSDVSPHPHFLAMKEHCAAKPGAVEDHPWGETVFKVRGKIFAFLGAGDRARVTVKPRPDDLDGLLALPFIERAAYIGRYGWVTVDAAEPDALELALDLIDTTYQQISRGKK
jgi:predicted DNA-binding protein (MmcQ/YjbR family)